MALWTTWAKKRDCNPALIYHIGYFYPTFCGLILLLSCSGKAVWKEEFWPTTAAEYALHLLWTLSKRGLWLSDPELRQAYVSAVPKVACR